MDQRCCRVFFFLIRRAALLEGTQRLRATRCGSVVCPSHVFTHFVDYELSAKIPPRVVEGGLIAADSSQYLPMFVFKG